MSLAMGGERLEKSRVILWLRVTLWGGGGGQGRSNGGREKDESSACDFAFKLLGSTAGVFFQSVRGGASLPTATVSRSLTGHWALLNIGRLKGVPIS